MFNILTYNQERLALQSLPCKCKRKQQFCAGNDIHFPILTCEYKANNVPGTIFKLSERLPADTTRCDGLTVGLPALVTDGNGVNADAGRHGIHGTQERLFCTNTRGIRGILQVSALYHLAIVQQSHSRDLEMGIRCVGIPRYIPRLLNQCPVCIIQPG